MIYLMLGDLMLEELWELRLGITKWHLEQSSSGEKAARAS